MKKICFMVATCLVANGLIGNISASEYTLKLPVSPLIAKESKARIHKNNFILAVATDRVVITANGLVTFPTLITQHGFQAPVNNTDFVIPRTGTYWISINIARMHLGPSSTDMAVELLIDGETNFSLSTELSSNFYVGGTEIPPVTYSRVLALSRGQTISLQLNSAAGSTITIPASSLYAGFANRAINIMLITRL